MTRERWKQVTETFDEALECPPHAREAYLERVCTGDHSLLSEVSRLLAEFEKAGDFLERPLATPGQAVSGGDLIAGRYRIEVLLGRGGMGEVYRAHDEFIKERVALKTLRTELSGNPGIIRRFQREVQLARKVTSASVCRVFEVGVHTLHDRPLHFFTMQLLEGETLAARIRRTGPLSKDEAFPLIAQMAEGLHAAHQVGIIHRDFKSSNVILFHGNAIVTDFGLARFEPVEGSLETASNLSENVQLAGTIAYMSPEQLSGGEVTAASDIYSFGIVLFEMATGKLPFDDRRIIQSVMQRAADFAPNVRAMAPKIEPQWATAITRCLQRDPSKRFSSAGEVAIHLNSSRWRPPMVNWTRRQWTQTALAAGVSAAGVALIPILSRFYLQDAKLPEGSEALLSPITNSTGDARFDGITELFRSQLSQSVHLSLIEDGKLGDILKQMGKAKDPPEPAAVREAAWRSNAALWITGTVSRVAADYALNVQVEIRGSQPDNPRVKSLGSFSASDPAALMRSVREASTWVRETIGESASSISSFDRLPADTTTPSWEALAAYARGQRFFMQQDFEPAILEFEGALRTDTGFTLAALRRADLLVSQNRQAEGFAQWKAAIAMLDKRPVTRAEELYARGMFAKDSGDPEAADRYFRTWSAEYPFDWRAPFYRVGALCMNGHANQALDLLKELRNRMPEYGDIYPQMIACHLILGHTEEARALVPEVRKRNRPERADLREAYIRFREADCTGCLEVLRSVERSTTYRRGAADAMVQEGLLLIDAGYPETAAANVEAFLRSGSWVETVPEQRLLRVVQAWGEMLAGRTKTAIEHARQAIEGETGPLAIALTGTIFARLGAAGMADRALRTCAGLLDIPLYRIAHYRILGEQARSVGKTETAVTMFRSAAALEPSIAHRQYLAEVLPEGSAERMQLCLNIVRIPWQILRPPPIHHIGALRLAVPVVNASTGVNEPFARKFAESSRKLGR